MLETQHPAHALLNPHQFGIAILDVL